MLNFNYLEKGLGIVSQPHFVNDFSRKMFLMLYCITEFHCLIAFTSQVLVNMCIVIVYFQGCDVMNFEKNLIFLIKPSFYLTKKF